MEVQGEPGPCPGDIGGMGHDARYEGGVDIGACQCLQVSGQFQELDMVARALRTGLEVPGDVLGIGNFPVDIGGKLINHVK